ncbi:hypothetical protein B0T19DRAFT_341835, partial [Cercophora scortea]
MELQTQDTPRQRSNSTAESAAFSLPEASTSASVPILRFPRPQGSKYLANWVSNSSPDILQPPIMSDAGSLADSAYEIINSTDSESQDGRLTESTGSLEAPQPDDVHSLDGSENHYDSETDDDESVHSSRASSIRYADEALENPSTQVSTNNFQYGLPAQGSDEILQSIEFQEEDDNGAAYLGKVSVKHAIRELAEEETATVAGLMGISEPPKRLVITIRQTMSPAHLSTKEPLRLLYVGSPEARKPIVLKVSTALWASPKIDASGEDSFNRDGVYNIVPISSFGPAPELELMEASNYQIKVEHCTDAEAVTHEGLSFVDDTMYSIIVDHETKFTSFFSPTGSVVQPRWTLPHIAIFYCANDDDDKAKQTRRDAWKFMNRHGVPSIFICESQSFLKSPGTSWTDLVNPHAVHMCLESRDPEKRIEPHRFPIDLTSFTNIDARQMNRNLAYLTGLSEPLDNSPALEGVESKPSKTLMERFDDTKRWAQNLSGAQVIEAVENNRWAMAFAVPLLMSLLASLWLSAFGGAQLAAGPLSTQIAPLTGDLGRSTATCASPYTPTSRAATTSTTTVVINVTSTKTVQISHAQPSVSSLAAALSYAGFHSERPSVEPETKKAHCSVHIQSPTEILVALSSGSKASWLAKGAIDIDVHRGEELVKTKLSSVDEGILVELAPKDAYGAFNVTVITTRKPKINETFEVDFGRPVMVETFEAGLLLLQDIAKAVSTTANEAVHLVEDSCVPAAAGIAKLRGEAASIFEHVLDAGKAVQSQAGETVNRVKHSLTPNEMIHFIKETKNNLSQNIKTAKEIRGDVNFSILRAQISSKLWWLKVQGKMQEYADYKRNASRYLTEQHALLTQGR